MKRMYKRCCIMMFATALLIFSMPVQASKADSRIKSTARQTYIFRTFLQTDDIKIESKGGNVTLTGIVDNNFDKALAGDLMGGISVVKQVDNRLEIKGVPPAVNSDA